MPSVTTKYYDTQSYRFSAIYLGLYKKSIINQRKLPCNHDGIWHDFFGCDPRPLFSKPVHFYHKGLIHVNIKYDHNYYISITNLMHWLLFIHKILFSSTCFEPQVLIFRRIQLYTCSIWYCHSLCEFLVACRYTAWVRTDSWGKVVWVS